MTNTKLEYLGNSTPEEYRCTENFDEWNLNSYKGVESLVDEFRGRLNNLANEATNEVLELCVDSSDAYGQMIMVGSKLKIMANLHVGDQKTFAWVIDFEDAIDWLSIEFTRLSTKEKEWKEFCADIESQIVQKVKEFSDGDCDES